MIEYRTVGGSATASEGVLNGLVTPFNVWTTIGDVKRGGFKERVAPGTFAKTLQERDVVLINAHDTSQPMARTSIREGAGSLTLTEDPAAGLRARALPVDTSYARDVMACADAGVTRGMSFGFEVVKDEWTDDAGRPSDSQRGTQRTIREVRLHEVTTTAFPAYETTQLSARDTINAARGVQEARADGPLPYADPKNKKYPVGDEAHAKAAWAYINVAKNADEYPLNGVTLAEVKDAIKAALKKFGVTISEENSAALALEWRSIGDELLDAAANLLTAYNRLPADLRDAGMAEQDPSESPAGGKSPCVGTCPACGKHSPGEDGDGDSDADDQIIDRTSEPAETTRDEISDEDYAAWRASAVAEAIRTR